MTNKAKETNNATPAAIIPRLADDLNAAMAQGVEAGQSNREWIAKLKEDITEIAKGAGRAKAKREAALASIAATVGACVTQWVESPAMVELAKSDNEAFVKVRKDAVYNPLRAINTTVGELFKVDGAPAKLVGNKTGGYKVAAAKTPDVKAPADVIASALDKLLKEHGKEAVQKGLAAAIKRMK